MEAAHGCEAFWVTANFVRSCMGYTSAASAHALMTNLPATELEIEKCRHADGASTLNEAGGCLAGQHAIALQSS